MASAAPTTMVHISSGLGKMLSGCIAMVGITPNTSHTATAVRTAVRGAAPWMRVAQR